MQGKIFVPPPSLPGVACKNDAVCHNKEFFFRPPPPLNPTTSMKVHLRAKSDGSNVGFFYLFWTALFHRETRMLTKTPIFFVFPTFSLKVRVVHVLCTRCADSLP